MLRGKKRSLKAHWLLIGATSGLMEAISHALATRGASLTLAARDEEALEHLAHDLSIRYGIQASSLSLDLDEKTNAVDFLERAGNFDHILIALGDMGNGEPDDIDNIEQVTRVNYRYPAELASVAAEILLEKRSGIIGLIGSVAGDRGRASNYAYGSAKAALATFASGLRQRYHKLGIQVVTIKPGFIDTAMTWGMKSKLIAERNRAAEVILRRIEGGSLVFYVPGFWRVIMLIIQHIPERIFVKLKF